MVPTPILQDQPTRAGSSLLANPRGAVCRQGLRNTYQVNGLLSYFFVTQPTVKSIETKILSETSVSISTQSLAPIFTLNLILITLNANPYPGPSCAHEVNWAWLERKKKRRVASN